VSAYHIIVEEETKNKDEDNNVAANNDHSVPEIQRTNGLEDSDRNYGNVKMKYHAGTTRRS
jgi:hypothetical protein